MLPLLELKLKLVMVPYVIEDCFFFNKSLYFTEKRGSDVGMGLILFLLCLTAPPLILCVSLEFFLI